MSYYQSFQVHTEIYLTFDLSPGHSVSAMTCRNTPLGYLVTSLTLLATVFSIASLLSPLRCSCHLGLHHPLLPLMLLIIATMHCQLLEAWHPAVVGSCICSMSVATTYKWRFSPSQHTPNPYSECHTLHVHSIIYIAPILYVHAYTYLLLGLVCSGY